MIFAGVVAGGSGRRMGGDLPKQFLPLSDSSVLLYTVQRFLRHPSVDGVLIGIHPDWRSLAQQQIGESGCDPKRVYLIDGGADRNETVSHMVSFALETLGAAGEDIILTHDAVRPFVTDKMIDDGIREIANCEICTAVIPETDTVAVSSGGITAEDFPDRSLLYRVQTPQVFRLGTFQKVYGSLSESEKRLATDVCRLYQNRGYRVHLFPGDAANLKLTYPFDYQFAQTLLPSITPQT